MKHTIIFLALIKLFAFIIFIRIKFTYIVALLELKFTENEIFSQKCTKCWNIWPLAALIQPMNSSTWMFSLQLVVLFSQNGSEWCDDSVEPDSTDRFHIEFFFRSLLLVNENAVLQPKKKWTKQSCILKRLTLHKLGEQQLFPWLQRFKSVAQTNRWWLNLTKIHFLFNISVSQKKNIWFFCGRKKNRFCFAIVRKSTAKYLFVPIFFPKINLFFADFIHRISPFILISALSQKRKRTKSKLTAECKTWNWCLNRKKKKFIQPNRLRSFGPTKMWLAFQRVLPRAVVHIYI